MNGLNLMTVIPGRNKVPGIYSSNFSPVDHSTMPMLTRLAIGAIVIQTADHDQSSCTEDCTLALWIKTCPADCDDSTWQSINLGPVVLPPDKYCVSGTLTAGNILVLNLSDGSNIQVDLSTLAQDNDTYPVSMALGAGNVLTITLNTGATVAANLSSLVVPVVTDGATVLGDGTAGNPLRQPTIAAKMRFSGTLGPIAPNTDLQVPFTTMDYNIGGAGALGGGATFTAPFDCIVHVDALAFFNFEAWNSAGAVAGVVILFKNGVQDTQMGVDYSIKGGNVVSGSPNEFKVPSGGIDVFCAAGDVLTIRAANGQSSGSSHTVFYAQASFHVVGAV